MMAAAQSFISGAISKTINLPNSATVEQIAESYRLSWELGLKSNALYRDGCKLSQPLNATIDSMDETDEEALEANGALDAADEMLEASLADATSQTNVLERVIERVIERPMRRRLPDTRQSLTHKFNVAGHEGYLIVGLYEDGSPGELFITMAKEGSTIGGLMDSLGTAISVALQYGVPVLSLVNKFAHQRFEPMGMTANRDIPFAKSLVDYIFRWLGMQFIEGYREANAPRRPPASDFDATSGTPTGTSTETSTQIPTPTKEESCDSKDASTGLTTPESAPERTGEPPAAIDPITMGEPFMSMSGLATEVGMTMLDQSNASLMGDAPACDKCGSITVRNGTCYRCMNCGTSMGCS
jgi:ribonucleoside-diphosphate reductase alpha chain